MSNTVTGSFTGVGVSANIVNTYDGEMTYAITGTFVAKVFLEHASTPDATSWYPIVGPLPVGSGTVPVRNEGTYRLNCYSYTSGTFSFTVVGVPPVPVVSRDAIDGVPIGQANPAAGTFSTFGVTGLASLASMAQTINTNWAGAAYPTGSNGALTSTQTYFGTPTGSGFNDSAGHTLPLNLIYVPSDQLNWATGGGIVSVFEVKHMFGGASSAGGRATFIIDSALLSAMPGPRNLTHSAFNIYHGAIANIGNATAGSGNGKGSYYATAITYGGLWSGVHVLEASAGEWNANMAAGSTADYLYGLKFINFSSNAWGNSGHAYLFECYLNFATATPGTTALLNDIIVFGDPQATDSIGCPVSPGGTLIRSLGGTATNAIDFSAMTISNAILLGPNNFKIRGDINRIITDSLQAANGGGVAVYNSSGGPQFATGGAGASTNYITISAATPGNSPRVTSVAGSGDAQADLIFQSGGATGTTGSFVFLNGANALQGKIVSVASAVSYPTLTPAASGPIQLSVGGTAASIILGTGAALATTATTGHLLIPTCAGAPTGVAGAAGQAGIIYDTTNSKLWLSVGGGTWKGVVVA